MGDKPVKISLKGVFGSSKQVLLQHPSVLAPLAVVPLLEAAALLLLYLAPRPPFLSVLGPPIRRFWGEAYLHYPLDLVLLPQTFQKAQLVIAVFAAPLLTAATAALIAGKIGEKSAPARAGEAVRQQTPKYFALLATAVAVYFLARFAMAGGALLVAKIRVGVSASDVYVPRMVWPAALAGLSLLLAVATETLFTFAVPAIAVEKRDFFGAVRRSFSLVRSTWRPVAALVGGPLLLYFSLLVARGNLGALMERTVPESVLVFLAFNVLVAFACSAFALTVSTVLLQASRRSEGGAA